MKAVVFEQFGDPAEVLQIREVPEPEPGPGQVRVRMLASPIGPADFLTVRGEYGHRPELPATPGIEGVGIVHNECFEAFSEFFFRRLAVQMHTATFSGN